MQPSTPHPTLRLGACLALLAAGSAWACKSRDDHRVDADRQVYEIIKERRDELAAGDAFTIEVPETTTRSRILAGEWEPEPLDLVACLEVAAENSRDYQTRREGLYLSALDLTLEQWEFSVQESGTFGAFLGDQAGAPRTGGFLADLGLTKLFETGLSIAGNASIDLVRDLSRGDGWDAISNLSLNITQPLLRGFGRDVVREPLTQAERDVLYEARTYERFRRTFCFDVASRFFLILQQEDTLQNETRNQERVTSLRERNEAFAEAGRLTDVDVDQARQNELAAETSVIDARRRLQSLLDDFKLFLGLPIETEMAVTAGDYLDLERWEALQVDFEEERVVAIALENRLDYLTELDRIEDARRKVEVAADALRAGLDLVLDGRAVDAEGEPIDLDAWTLSLNLDAPFERLPERNAYRASLIDLEVSERSAEEAADAITRDVREQLRRLRAAEQNLAIERGAVILAERRVESTALSLEAGRAETRDVLEAQQDLVVAQNAASAALTEYILAGLALYRDMELIRVTEAGITIDSTPLTGPLTETEDTP